MTILMLLIGFLACNSNETPHNKARNSTTYSTAKSSADTISVNKEANATERTTRISGDIIARHKVMGKNPEDAIALWVEATIRAQNGEKGAMKALGYLSIVYKKNKSWRSESHFMGKIEDNEPCFRSLVIGATPENGYRVDMDNIKINVRDGNSKSSDGEKWFVVSSGADTPRPVHVKKSSKSGLYFIYNFSSLHVDVKPAITNAETFE